MLRLLAGTFAAALIAPGAAVATQPGALYPSSAPGAPCSSAGASAQNQYCEDIPSAGGPQTPGSSGPTLAGTLPAPVRARLLAGARNGAASAAGSSRTGSTHPPRARTRTAANVLLTLPGAPRWSFGSAPAASASAVAPVTWLIVLLAALAVSAAVLAALRHRRTPTA